MLLTPNSIFIAVSFIGIILSAYSLYIEKRKEHDNKYVASCDINEAVSCSKVFTSTYGKGFGILQSLVGDHWINQPNSVYGILFYSMIFLLGISNSPTVQGLILMLSITACFSSVYLGYILFFVVKGVCIICIITYVINLILLLTSIYNYCAIPYSSHLKTT